eukprot:3761414-Pyramimonas_sp.AAC.1
MRAVCAWGGAWSRHLRQVAALQDCTQGKGDSAGKPAIAKLDTDSANVAEGSGENLPAILGLRGVSNTRAIFILEQGHEAMVIP